MSVTVFKLLISLISYARYLVKYLETLSRFRTSASSSKANARFAEKVAAYLRFKKFRHFKKNSLKIVIKGQF